MKIRRVSIENFKRFGLPGGGLELKIENDVLAEVADRFLLLGENGSGKTTVLQAVALTLSLATGKTQTIDDFRWAGWVPERYLAHGPPVVEVDVSFEDDEIAATQEAFRRWYDVHGAGGSADNGPADQREVTLRLEGSSLKNEFHVSERLQMQFQGRRFVEELNGRDPEARKLFERLPDVFWFDQFRNAQFRPNVRAQTEGPDATPSVHDTLKAWSRIRAKRRPHGEGDVLTQLEQLYQKVFPGRSFADLEDIYGGSPTPVDERFVLTDGRRTYALEEMSAGEQNVFPLLFEFVQRKIHRSVVLIDEIDLNLHPSLAQRIYGLLPQLGRHNQFLFTSHNQAIIDVVSPHTVRRLPGDGLCL